MCPRQNTVEIKHLCAEVDEYRVHPLFGKVLPVSDLIGAIRAELGSYESLEALDIRVVVEILRGAFPEVHPRELAFEVARAAIEQGCRYFVWEPSALD